ncbi:uncharacterized protein LOC110116351, partial [Dendrobium catenatum]|uniref:uncharacterized protein LOC110116351 n=1 Tax=Dendrobium catenatum TaxID=906689 RepID=UPI0010A00D02
MTGWISSPSYPIFTGENYDYWSVKMMMLFRSLNLWEIVEDGISTEVVSTSNGSSNLTQIRVDKQKDAKALFILQQAESDTIFPRIMWASSSKQAWEILQEEFQGNSKIRTIKLQALSEQKKEWFLDSGCSNHMTQDESLFTHIDKSVCAKIKLGNGEMERTRLIRDVLLVPSLDQSLLSVWQMMQNG